MLQNEQNRARTSWVRRIVMLLRTAEVWQLREIFYMVSGYIGPPGAQAGGRSREAGAGTPATGCSRCPGWTRTYKNICEDAEKGRDSTSWPALQLLF